MPKISKIEPTVATIQQKEKVAAYAWVSMQSERMIHSLLVQISFYSELIQKKLDWEYAGVYADGFISGNNTIKRDEFNRMIADCEAGKIEMFLAELERQDGIVTEFDVLVYYESKKKESIKKRVYSEKFADILYEYELNLDSRSLGYQATIEDKRMLEGILEIYNSIEASGTDMKLNYNRFRIYNTLGYEEMILGEMEKAKKYYKDGIERIEKEEAEKKELSREKNFWKSREQFLIIYYLS